MEENNNQELNENIENQESVEQEDDKKNNILMIFILKKKPNTVNTIKMLLKTILIIYYISNRIRIQCSTQILITVSFHLRKQHVCLLLVDCATMRICHHAQGILQALRRA